jgi:hypothetical protein
MEGMDMATVTYTGSSALLEHRSSGQALLFNPFQPLKVTLAQALFYQGEAERNGPWVVELDTKDKLVEASEAIVSKAKKAIKG